MLHPERRFVNYRHDGIYRRTLIQLRIPVLSEKREGLCLTILAPQKVLPQRKQEILP
jgi:hypothetical protein